MAKLRARRSKFITALLPLVLAFAVIQSLAEELPTGKILEKIVCKADANESYALYLPSNYTPQKTWPILYAFDAGARGSLPVKRFKEAAEKYGYIVAGSNNSRNGPNEPILAAVNAVFRDTQDRLALDDRRIYVAGFSGGARVAVSVGNSLKGRVAGVIGCGAGFPPEITPSASSPFVYFGTTGTDDFNNPEMKELDQALAEEDGDDQADHYEGCRDEQAEAQLLQVLDERHVALTGLLLGRF